MFVCNNCGFSSDSKMYLCPKCQGDDIREDTNVVVKSKNNKNSVKISYNSIRNKITPVNKDTNTTTFNVVKTTQFKELNKMISNDGGFIESQVILLAADPGVGKTTLCSQICPDENCLFISTEETAPQVKHRFKRVNPYSTANIFCSTDEEEILCAIEESPSRFIVVDSANSIDNGGNSYARVAQFIENIVKIVKQTRKCAIIISQVTRSGEIIGFNSAIHVVDTVLNMSRSTTSENIFIVSTKNRFGTIGDIILFRHEETGLVESEQESMEPTVGTSCFYMYSGSKKIPFSIQALICPTSEMRPMRKAVGIGNIQQVYVWNAILTTFDKNYNTHDMDIFMQTSQGIPLQPGSDVACLNALLSSYYNKVVKFLPQDLVGSCNLNGNITGNHKFKHVSELIKMYK